MSDDSDKEIEIEIDLSDRESTSEDTSLLTNAAFMLLEKALHDEVVAESEDVAPDPDPDLNSMTPWAREAWASEDGIGRAETSRRLEMITTWEREHGGARLQATVERTGWGDVPLDGLLTQIAAGTLVLPKPTVGMLADGSCGLFYAGRVNGVAGESGGGKGWVALSTAIEQMRRGIHAYYLDYEDSPALVTLRLVVVLKADPDMVRRLFHYVHPVTHNADAIAEFVERVAANGAAFVVIDSTGESMALAGLNGDRDPEVAAWMQALAHPLADRGGATVLLLDHLVKATDGGLWASGSQRKRAAITGAQYILEVADPFSDDKDGMAVLKVAKDRHGAREKNSVATYIQFRHPIVSQTVKPDGTFEAVLGKSLDVVFGSGRTAAQAQALKATQAAAALAADVALLDRLNPPPTGGADVRKRMRWGGLRAQAAVKAWKAKQKAGGAS